MTKVIRFLVKKKVHPHRENPGYAYARIKTSMSDFIWISLPVALEDDNPTFYHIFNINICSGAIHCCVDKVKYGCIA